MLLLKLLLEFMKIGAFTFGGGYAMIPLIQDVVLKHKWINNELLIDFIAVSESTPGPIAINMSTFVGARTAGIGGAAIATLGVIIPSFIIIYIVAHFYEKFIGNKYVNAFINGIKPAVIALIGVAAISVFDSIFNVFNFISSFGREKIIAMAVLVLAGFLNIKKINPIYIICTCAATSIIINVLIDYCINNALL